MHLRRVHIRNIRSIADLTWELPDDAAGPGWHVILGDNGAGKSSFLRAIALVFVGKKDAAALRQPWGDWIRAGASTATVKLRLDLPNTRRDHLNITFDLTADDVNLTADDVNVRGTVAPVANRLWQRGEYFSASYGPFRRFTGGDKEVEKLFSSQPILARHLSVFGESIALTEALSWLQSLKFKQLEGSDEGRLLDSIIAFVNQPDFLPHDVRLRDITSNGVEFIDSNGFKVPVQHLSDGYRSVLSMTFELIRQMTFPNGSADLFSKDHTQIVRPGVVIVDEIDAHLHPSWQRTIGLWFRKHFPNVQFIVSTHSPLICQAADVGSVYRLPQPGVPDDRGEMVQGLALKRLLYGNVLDAYGTGVFGNDVSRSDSGQEKLEQLAELNAQEILGSLNEEEKRTQEALRDMLPTDASIGTRHDPAT